MLCAGILLCSVNSYAEEIDDSQTFVDENKKRVEVAKLLQLEKSEAKEFWSLYDEYSKELAKIHKEMFHLVQDFQVKNTNQSITDEIADQFLDKTFDIEIRKWTIKKEYKEKFKQVLPSKDVARFFQLDNKIDIQLLYELSSRIDMIN